MNQKQFTLKVAEAYPSDAGRGIVRIDPQVARELGLTSGDVVEIVGKKRTFAIYWHGRPEDSGKEVIRMDKQTRENAGVGLDDKVTVKKVEAKIAEKVTLAPTQPLRIFGGESYILQLLEGRVVARGDIVTINIMRNKVDFVVTGISPPVEAVIITPETNIVISEEVAKGIPSGVPRVSYED
ncbi:MAG: AAA family ATPase, partial [Thermoproteota archaeon]